MKCPNNLLSTINKFYQKYIRTQILVIQETQNYKYQMENQYSRDQGIEYYLQEISKIVDLLGQEMKKSLKQKEQKLVLRYMDELKKTKQQFNKLQGLKSENIVDQKIINEKNLHKKQSNITMSQSLRISQNYELLKLQLSEMKQAEKQLDLELNYLNKQINSAQKRNQNLMKEFEIIKDQKKKLENQVTQDISAKTVFLSRPLSNRSNKVNQNPPQISHSLFRQPNKWDLEQQKVIKNRIDQIKQYKSTIILAESPLQPIYKGYNILNYRTDRKKLQLIQEVLSKKQNKQYIYHLLFDDQFPNQSKVQ